MNQAIEYLQKQGYSISSDYYDHIEEWINIWKGKADWLNIKTVNNTKYPMYSLGMAKRSCEDLASIITSEPFTIKAKSNDEKLKQDLKETKVLEKLPEAIEIMAYSGTVGSVARILNAEVIGEGEEASVTKGKKTKKKTILLKGNQIIPLKIEDGEIIDCAFVSQEKKKVEGKSTNLIYLEIHELKEKGYQVTNKYIRADNGKEVYMEGMLETYNTLSQTPLFSITKLPKVNPIDNNNGLGISLFGDSIDQLKMLDLTYNNFGLDFRVGQKIMIINKKLTRVETEEYKDKDGNIKTRDRIVYPTDIQKQLFQETGTGIMDGESQQPYIYEYNPDLRVGDNKEGIQFALNNWAFKLGFGTHYYSFENGMVTTATEAIISRHDYVSNGNKIRKTINEFLKNICSSLLLCDKILGESIDETQEIEIAEVDGFLEDDATIRERLSQDVAAGYITKKRYLMKVYGMTEKEAKEELEDIESETEINSLELGE